MAIRISWIQRNSKCIRGKDIAAVAREIEEALNHMGLEGCVQISWVYSDNWIPVDLYEKKVN